MSEYCSGCKERREEVERLRAERPSSGPEVQREPCGMSSDGNEAPQKSGRED